MAPSEQIPGLCEDPRLHSGAARWFTCVCLCPEKCYEIQR